MKSCNRATLHRQFLLGGVRPRMSTVDAVHRLAGLNAQDRGGAQLSLGARELPADVDAALADRTLVRAPLLRGTQHIVTADDYLAWWPILRPVLTRTQRFFGRMPEGLESFATDVLADGPLTRSELAQRLGRRWPEHDPKALASSVQFLVPVVHPPTPNGRTVLALAQAWLGRPVSADIDPKPLIARYLAAFGPATVKDVQVWSGLTRLRGPVSEMALEQLGDGLYDLPGAPRPEPDTPAPTRLLPYVDNLITAHADRSRIMDPEVQKRVCLGAAIRATVLHDGRVVGTWWAEGGALRVEMLVPTPGFDPTTLKPPIAHYPRY